MYRNIILFSLFLIILTNDPFSNEEEYKIERSQMVDEQIIDRGIHDKLTIQAMLTVKRHKFVPKKYLFRAYYDGPLSIGYGQTISQPYIVAYMTEVIEPKPDHKVLEIGTGSGYQAAVLAKIVKKVYTVEIITKLGNIARKRLKNLGYTNIEIKTGDGYHGWKEHAPFDAIVVTAAADFVPPPLVKQLKDGGKMIIPVGSPFLVQTLMLIEKKGDKVTTKNLLPVRFVPFTRGKR
ncbi:MAG: protein-L-isoaspartate(D-aspartate) O-methyltransferase [Chitinispirillia bacterium]|jgi:protein-L-isoaspartate(D-aspartate) O-methyltransferase